MSDYKKEIEELIRKLGASMFNGGSYNTRDCVEEVQEYVSTLINQKEKEARIDELQRFDKQMEYDHYEDVLEIRIKQLKEELKEEQL